MTQMLLVECFGFFNVHKMHIDTIIKCAISAHAMIIQVKHLIIVYAEIPYLSLYDISDFCKAQSLFTQVTVSYCLSFHVI